MRTSMIEATINLYNVKGFSDLNDLEVKVREALWRALDLGGIDDVHVDWELGTPLEPEAGETPLDPEEA